MTTREKINPSIKANSLMILLTMLAPQLVLILFRLRDLHMIRDEIQEHSLLIQMTFIGIPLIIGGLALLMVLWSRGQKREVPRLALFGFFILQTASLVHFLIAGADLIPSSVDAWIINAGTFFMLQTACTMPGLFYGLICIANLRWFKRVWVDIVTSLGLLVAVPGIIYFLAISSMAWRGDEAFVIGLSVGATLIAAFAFIQLLLWLSRRMNHSWIPMLIFALVFPVAGLLINRLIPFPADLQHWGFYALSVANALILLWSCMPGAKDSRRCAFATAFSYPFTCYFFILFLPFLPFSLIAMIAFGAGFLILTPPILFILHTRQLVLQFQTLRTSCSIPQLATGFLVAFLLVPVGYVGRALHHRNIFMQTLDRVYAAPLTDPGPMPSPKTAAYALQKLKDSKTGKYVPILSEAYNRIVFGGMVLPDGKIRQLSQLLLGEDSDEWSPDDDFQFYSFFTGENTRTAGRDVWRPSRDVSLSDIECRAETEAGVTEAFVLLTLQNNINRQAEFVTDILLPDGVFVSGYDLKIGDEMVPARLSDRKAAMWVYHMIRDRARRDPGLIVYTQPNILRLSVFPLAGKEERQCVLKLIYPEGTTPEIQVGTQTVALPCSAPQTVAIVTASGNQALCIPPARARQYEGIFRTIDKTALSGTADTPGYCPEWDVKGALLEYWQSGDNQITQVPWFVTETEQPTVAFDGAAYWLPLIPDGGWLKNKPEPRQVLPFQCADEVRVIPVETGGMAIFNSEAPLELFDGDSQSLEPFKADVELGPESRFSKATDVWQMWWHTQLHPEEEEALRKELLLAARENNILVPSTAFLAVESSAQQKALEKAENKSLKSHSALAFDEFDEADSIDSPEPGFLLLAILVLPLAHWIHSRKNRHEAA